MHYINSRKKRKKKKIWDASEQKDQNIEKESGETGSKSRWFPHDSKQHSKPVNAKQSIIISNTLGFFFFLFVNLSFIKQTKKLIGREHR